MTNIVDVLWRVHNDPGGRHEAALADVNPSFDDGQHLQLELLGRWLEQGEQIGGWKIGMTSGASRNAMGEGVRPFGFILASRIRPSGAALDLESLCRGQVENELCMVMGAPLGAGATAAEARAAVAAVAPAFEINQKRLPPDAEPGLRVADNLSNWGIVAGDGVAPPMALADLHVTLSSVIDGEPRAIEAVHSNGHIDDHYESLATLARRLAAFGHRLEAGQRVITGAYGKTPFAPGTYRGEFDLGIGAVEVTLG